MLARRSTRTNLLDHCYASDGPLDDSDKDYTFEADEQLQTTTIKRRQKKRKTVPPASSKQPSGSLRNGQGVDVDGLPSSPPRHTTALGGNFIKQLRWLVTSLNTLGNLTWRKSTDDLDMFTIHCTTACEEEMSRFFTTCKWDSLKRQLNNYGFVRIIDPLAGGTTWFHRNFNQAARTDGLIQKADGKALHAGIATKGQNNAVTQQGAHAGGGLANASSSCSLQLNGGLSGGASFSSGGSFLVKGASVGGGGGGRGGAVRSRGRPKGSTAAARLEAAKLNPANKAEIAAAFAKNPCRTNNGGGGGREGSGGSGRNRKRAPPMAAAAAAATFFQPDRTMAAETATRTKEPQQQVFPSAVAPGGDETSMGFLATLAAAAEFSSSLSFLDHSRSSSHGSSDSSLNSSHSSVSSSFEQQGQLGGGGDNGGDDVAALTALESMKRGRSSSSLSSGNGSSNGSFEQQGQLVGGGDNGGDDGTTALTALKSMKRGRSNSSNSNDYAGAHHCQHLAATEEGKRKVEEAEKAAKGGWGNSEFEAPGQGAHTSPFQRPHGEQFVRSAAGDVSNRSPRVAAAAAAALAAAETQRQQYAAAAAAAAATRGERLDTSHVTLVGDRNLAFPPASSSSQPLHPPPPLHQQQQQQQQHAPRQHAPTVAALPPPPPALALPLQPGGAAHGRAHPHQHQQVAAFHYAQAVYSATQQQQQQEQLHQQQRQMQQHQKQQQRQQHQHRQRPYHETHPAQWAEFQQQQQQQQQREHHHHHHHHPLYSMPSSNFARLPATQNVIAPLLAAAPPQQWQQQYPRFHQQPQRSAWPSPLLRPFQDHTQGNYVFTQQRQQSQVAQQQEPKQGLCIDTASAVRARPTPI